MQHIKQTSSPRPRRGAAAESATRARSAADLTDNRPAAMAQRQLAEAIENGPRSVAQRSWGAAMRDSSRGAAQRKRLIGLSGETAQLASGPEEELLQGRFAPVQRQGGEEEEMLQGKFDPVQRAGEEEEPLQGKFEAVQRVGSEEEESLQAKFEPAQRQGGLDEEEPLQGRFAPTQRAAAARESQENRTGLPDNLKSGIESLAGMSMDNVRVHYNSSQPAELNALAYAQGSDIHVAPGQEQHLPHEAWHVVQQAQGRVRPTMQMKDGIPVNDNKSLEREADVMGARANQIRAEDMLEQVAKTSTRVEHAHEHATTQRQLAIEERDRIIQAIPPVIEQLKLGTSRQATVEEVRAHDEALSPGQHHQFRQVLRTALIGDLEQRLGQHLGFNRRDNQALIEENQKRKPNVNKVTQL